MRRGFVATQAEYQLCLASAIGRDEIGKDIAAARKAAPAKLCGLKPEQDMQQEFPGKNSKRGDGQPLRHPCHRSHCGAPEKQAKPAAPDDAPQGREKERGPVEPFAHENRPAHRERAVEIGSGDNWMDAKP